MSQEGDTNMKTTENVSTNKTASASGIESPPQNRSAPGNLYTPLLLPSHSESDNVAEALADRSAEDKIKLACTPDKDRKKENRSSAVQCSQNLRSHRSLVRPFFCCGSEISLVSLVEGMELKEKPSTSSLEKSISLPSSFSVPGCSAAASEKSRHSGSRRKKKEKQSLKKKFWSLQFRGRWNRQWSVPQPRSNAHSHSCEPCSGYGSAGSPRSNRYPSRARQMAAATSSHFIDLSQVQEFDRLFPVEDIVVRQPPDTFRPNENETDALSRQRTTNVVVSSSFLDILRRHRLNSNTSESSSLHLSDSPVEDYPDLIMSRFVFPWQGHKDGAVVGSAQIHTQVDYIHYLVPDLTRITSCSFYWGVMDRYEAERLLDNKPEGTFLLRDSAQEDFLFSVSFRRYNRSLHARVEQWNHLFSFDAHDPAVFSAPTVCELMEHYKDSSLCMFFEPMLTHPLHRNFPFSLQHLSRAAICDQIGYDDIRILPLPNSLKQFLQIYHYKQKCCVRRFDEY